MPNETVELIENIRKSFADVSKPSDDNLIVGDQAHIEKCNECRNALQYFKGQTKDTIANDTNAARQLINAFSFFTPTAWHYYLPEYLIGCLQNERLRFDDLWHHNEPIVKERFWLERINLLTEPQCAVLIKYLTHLLHKIDPKQDRALDCQKTLNWWQEIYQKTFAPK